MPSMERRRAGGQTMTFDSQCDLAALVYDPDALLHAHATMFEVYK